MISAKDAISCGRSLIGTPYSELDCINFIKKIIRISPGGDPKYTDAHVPALWDSYHSSRKYQHLTQQIAGVNGAVPGMLAFKGRPLGHDGEPSHVGLVATPTTVLHSSSAKGQVVETDLHNGQWTLLGVHCLIKPSAEGGNVMPDETTKAGYPAVVIALANDKPVNLRIGPSTDDRIITKLPVGTKVAVVTDTGDWCFVDTGECLGYMMSKFLAEVDHDGDNPEVDPDPDPDPGQQGWFTNPCLVSESGSVIHLDGSWRMAMD